MAVDQPRRAVGAELYHYTTPNNSNQAMYVRGGLNQDLHESMGEKAREAGFYRKS